MDEIEKYFPELTDIQRRQFDMMLPLYQDWNEKINVISRKDINNLYLHHVLHSLAIANVMRFKATSHILDLGSGGGFPGIPLAIFFPDVQFSLVDSINKKMHVAQEVADALGLKNVQTFHTRAEDMKAEQFDFIVSRAVAPLEQLKRWSFKLLKKKHQNILPNGLLALKGGDNLKAEIKELGKGEYADATPIKTFFTEPYFDEKFVVYVQG